MRCAICGNSGIFTHFERRPSGPRNRMKNEPFCDSCWAMLQEQRNNREPWIVAKYALFIEYLAGHYDRRIIWRAHYQPQKGRSNSGAGNQHDAAKRAKDGSGPYTRTQAAQADGQKRAAG
jgi:hypothetical protein